MFPLLLSAVYLERATESHWQSAFIKCVQSFLRLIGFAFKELLYIWKKSLYLTATRSRVQVLGIG